MQHVFTGICARSTTELDRMRGDHRGAPTEKDARCHRSQANTAGPNSLEHRPLRRKRLHGLRNLKDEMTLESRCPIPLYYDPYMVYEP